VSEKKILDGQTAVVTGANSGIGEAIVRAMARAGANVVLNYVVNDDAAAQIVTEIRNAGGVVVPHKADISREDQVKDMFERVIKKFGAVDILVNNAGLQRDAALVDMTLSQWSLVLEVNLTGSFLCSREAARAFLRQGVIPAKSMAAGKIIFVSSVHETIPWAGHANYAASKGGLLMLMKTIAQELAPRKVRVNSIAPGAIKTNINRSAWDTPEAEARLVSLIPYDRVGEVSDIGKVAVWLASDDSDYVTGTTLFADGGMLLYPGFRTGG